MQTNNVSAIRPQGVLSGNNGTNAPETDGFDFMSYFLGLQVGGSESEVSDGLEGLLAKNQQAPAEGSEDPLLALFQKNKNANPSWSTMCPAQLVGGMQVNQPNQAVVSTDEARQVGQPMPFALDGAASAKSDRLEKSKQDTTAQNSQSKNVNGAAQNAAQFAVGAQGKFESRQGESSPSAVAANGPAPEATTRAKNRVQGAEKVESGTNGTPLTQSLLHPFGNEEVTGTEKKNQRRDNADVTDGFAIPGQTQNVAQNPNAPVMPAKGSETQSVPELFKQVETMAHKGGGTMTVTMSPAHLGQVEIQVTTRGKKVEIEMKSSSDLAKSVIESHLSDLKQSLHGQDLQLSKVEVQVGKEVVRTMTGNTFAELANGNQSFMNQSQQFSNGSNSNNGRRGFDTSHGTNSSQRLSAISANSPVRGTIAASGRVDIRI